MTANDDLLAEAAQYENSRGFDADLIRRMAARITELEVERDAARNELANWRRTLGDS